MQTVADAYGDLLMNTYTHVFFDGGCWPNPGGLATFGYVIKMSNGQVKEGLGIIGDGTRMTNNVAEYRGLIEAMHWLILSGLNNEPIIFHGDSRLVIEQMIGRYRVPKNKKPYADHAREAHNIKQQFTAATFKWIPREQNTEADALTELAKEAAPNSAPVG